MIFEMALRLFVRAGVTAAALVGLLLVAVQPVRAASGITSPGADEVLSGQVSVQGSAEHPTFRKWQVDLVLEGSDGDTTFLALGDEPVVDGELFVWDTSLYPDGNHRLRLRVVHSNLNYDEYYVPVTLRNGQFRAIQKQAGTENPAAVPELPPTVDAPDAERWIQIDISDQRLIGWENGEVRFDYTVSTGKPGYRTLPGTFSVYQKYVETRMRGYDYDTPDVPWTMYYYGGFAIHGAYWHDNFGTPVSHGCVNLPVEQARALYEWADVGTTVVVND